MQKFLLLHHHVVLVITELWALAPLRGILKELFVRLDKHHQIFCRVRSRRLGWLYTHHGLRVFFYRELHFLDEIECALPGCRTT
jgi:hypothetical protein